MAKLPTDLTRLLAAVNKQFKGAASFLADGSKGDVLESIPSGLEVLDRYVLGCGGWPIGRISEVFSEEGGGKTSLLLRAMASVQQLGGTAVIVETETALDSKRAESFGVDLSKVVLLQPGHLGEATQQIELVLRSIQPSMGPVLIGWDSVAATQSKEEALDGIPDKDSFDKRAKGISQAMRVLNPLLPVARAHLMLINQVRANIGVMFGDKHVTPGGKAIKFHATHRVQLLGGKSIKDPIGQHMGKDVTVMAVKNKVVRPYRKARIRLMYDSGWDSDWSTLDHAKTLKLIDGRARDVVAARKLLDAAAWSSVGAEAGVGDLSDLDVDEED